VKTWRVGVVAIALLAAGCAHSSAPAKHTDYAFAAAQRQAFELGPVLGAIRACEGEAWQVPFAAFMAAKRARLDDRQTATIATLVGAAQSHPEPEMLECSAGGQSQRTAAIDVLRKDW
jgi:hypothetical protein